MDKKHLLCLIPISLVSLTNISAQTSEQTKPTLNWYGFVNNQMYFDDRESLQEQQIFLISYHLILKRI